MLLLIKNSLIPSEPLCVLRSFLKRNMMRFMNWRNWKQKWEQLELRASTSPLSRCCSLWEAGHWKGLLFRRGQSLFCFSPTLSGSSPVQFLRLWSNVIPQAPVPGSRNSDIRPLLPAPSSLAPSQSPIPSNHPSNSFPVMVCVCDRGHWTVILADLYNLFPGLWATHSIRGWL